MPKLKKKSFCDGNFIISSSTLSIQYRVVHLLCHFPDGRYSPPRFSKKNRFFLLYLTTKLSSGLDTEGYFSKMSFSIFLFDLEKFVYETLGLLGFKTQKRLI